MSTISDICQVCLRGDRELKVIDSRLAEYHDELCDYSVDAIDPQYCNECGHMLRKVYNFKAKCLLSAKILKNWKKGKAALRKPVSQIHTLLPPATIGFWSENNTKIYSFNYDEGNRVVGDTNTTTDPKSSLASSSYIVVVPGRSVGTICFDEYGNQQPQNPLQTDIKIECEDDTDFKDLEFKDLISFKTEKSFEEILVKNDGDEGKIKMVNEDHLLDDASLNSDDDITSSDSDDYDSLYTSVRGKRSAKKRTLADLADSMKNVAPKKKIVRTKEVKKSAAKKKAVTDKVVKERFHTKRDIIAELSSALAAESDAEKPKRKRNALFTKERLKALVTKQFESCGELKTEDGSVIDKQFIIDSLDEKVTEFVMKQLWNAVRGKPLVSKKALKIYRCIQNKYKHEYESMFNIEYLNTKEKIMEEFQNRKNYECYLKAEHKCEICYQGFKHAKKLEYHQKSHDESSGELACSICNVRHKQKKALIGHIVNSHEAVYKCKLCPLVTYYKGSMVNHYQWHKGVKFRCEPCDVTFTSQSSYRSHLSYRHARRHVCIRCGRAFCTVLGLKWHTTRNHQDEPSTTESDVQVKCASCELMFPSQEVMERHHRITHEAAVRGRPPAGTTRRTPRKFGERKKPTLTCRVCNAVGHSIGWLRLHFNTDHPSTDMELVYADTKTHLCDICGKGFSTLYILQAHQVTHSDVRPFACELCHKRFRSRVLLRNHSLSHLPPGKPCQYCGKKFRSQSNLANHVRFHIGDRRYKCKLCGKGFLHRSTLNEHVRGVHHNVRRVRKRGVADTEEMQMCH